jgi:sporulation protein YlmC with PRC-barrel domain
MNKQFHMASIAIAATVVALGFAPMVATAQVAGMTTTSKNAAPIADTSRVAMGWSVKKTLMGKAVYNDAGQKVGKVDDLIISPDKAVSLVIVGAGGFVGIGRHDVAIPINQLQEKSGKLVMSGATKESIKAMPSFDYSGGDTHQRDEFVAAAQKQIDDGRASLATLDQKMSNAAADAKVKMKAQSAALKVDLQNAEARLNDMKHASAKRWQEFEVSVNAATARLAKSINGLAA